MKYPKNILLLSQNIICSTIIFKVRSIALFALYSHLRQLCFVEFLNPRVLQHFIDIHPLFVVLLKQVYG